jgi:hypothetical protein
MGDKSDLPFPLTRTDYNLLALTDEEYTPMSWEYCKEVIGKYPLSVVAWM